MLIISGRLAREPELKKVIVGDKKKFVVDNCIFVNSSSQTKDGTPVNITAWDKNATYIADNFEKGEKINIVGLERLQIMKIGEKTFGICSFTVIKIIDWKIYRAITGMLHAFISRMINCADLMPENLINAELLEACVEQDTERKIKSHIEQKYDEEKHDEEKLKEEKEKGEDEKNGQAEIDSVLDCNNNGDQVEDELKDNGKTENNLDFEIDELGTVEDGGGASGYEDNGQFEDEEDDEEWAHVREPSGYYILDFSVVRKEDYHN